MKGNLDMVAAFGACVGVIHAIPVEGKPGCEHQPYVLEIDICPAYLLTKEYIFSYRDANDKEVSFIREGSSVIQSTAAKFDKEKNKKVFITQRNDLQLFFKVFA